MYERYEVIHQELKSKSKKISSSLKDILIEWNQYAAEVELLQNKFAPLLEDLRALKKENKEVKRNNEYLRHSIWKCLSLLHSKDGPGATKASHLKEEYNFDYFLEFFKCCSVKAFQNEEFLQVPSPKNKATRCLFQVHHRENQESQECQMTKKGVNENGSRNHKGASFDFQRSETTHDQLVHIQESTCLPDVPKVDSLLAPSSTLEAAMDQSLTFCQSPAKDGGNGVRDHVGSEKGNPLLDHGDILISAYPVKRRSPESERLPTGASRKKLKGKPRTAMGGRSGFMSDAQHLKKTFMSDGGIKKLTQTILNIDVFKKLSPLKRENSIIPSERLRCSPGTVVAKADVDDADDFIGASPRTVSPPQLTFTSSRRGRGDDKSKYYHHGGRVSDCIDLDETYVPAHVVGRLKGANGNIGCDNEASPIANDPRRRPVRDKSPEFESVPYVYKKVAEKTCLQLFEETHSKETLDEGRRSRSEGADLNDTPPGYWKPYLTCSPMVPSVEHELKMRE